jgi:hypothetical protein
MTKGGRIAMGIVTSLAGGIVLVLLPAASDDGYARLFLVILAVVYLAVVLLVFVLDKWFRLARDGSPGERSSMGRRVKQECRLAPDKQRAARYRTARGVLVLFRRTARPCW